MPVLVRAGRSSCSSPPLRLETFRHVTLRFISLLVSVLPACSNDLNHETVTVTDSAGVTIVESLKPLWEEGEGWRLSEEPVLTIGSENGPEEYSLYGVAAALRLPDGNIVIANSGTDELRYYDSTGNFLHSVGQDGFGPGEFKRMSGVWLVGDSIFVNDWGQDRLSVFSASGEYGRTIMLHREPGSSQTVGVGVFADGTILGRQFVFDRDNSPEQGLRYDRINVVYGRNLREGELLNSIGEFLWRFGLSEVVSRTRDPSTGVAYQSGIFSDAPFGRAATTVAFGDNLYHGSSETYEIRVISKTGSLSRIIRRPIPNPPVTERDREEFRDYFVEDGDDWSRRRVRDLVFPETKPAYGDFIVDALGNIWVAEFSMGHDDRAGIWNVFDRDGRWLGTVRVPPGGRYIEIGADHVLGRWRTELDVEQVRMYRLLKDWEQ